MILDLPPSQRSGQLCVYDQSHSTWTVSISFLAMSAPDGNQTLAGYPLEWPQSDHTEREASSMTQTVLQLRMIQYFEDLSTTHCGEDVCTNETASFHLVNP